MDQNEEANFYFTLMEFASIVSTHGDATFAELEFLYPDVYDQFKAYLCNREIKLLDE